MQVGAENLVLQRDQLDSLINERLKSFDSGNFNEAIKCFREVQILDKTLFNSLLSGFSLFKENGK
jgi:hypothetical protein